MQIEGTPSYQRCKKVLLNLSQKSPSVLCYLPLGTHQSLRLQDDIVRLHHYVFDIEDLGYRGWPALVMLG